MSKLRVLSLACRLLAIAIVVASPWLAPRPQPSSARSVVYIIDRSSSVGESGVDIANAFVQRAWFDRGEARLGVVAFDAIAEVITPVGTPDAPTVHMRTDHEPDRQADEAASDLAAGIRLGIAALPVSGHRSLVLLTDARPTRGDAAAEVRRAAELGIRVDLVALESEPGVLPLVVAVKPRATHVAEHQPVAFDVDVRTDGNFVINWKRDGAPMPPKHHYFQQGESTPTVELLDPTPPPGVHVYEVRASAYAGYAGRGWGHHGGGGGGGGSGSDDQNEKPSALTAVSVEGKAHAAIFSSAGDVPPVLKAALTESGLEARPLPLERAGDPSAYSGADLVVLSDVRVSGASTDEAGLTRTAQASLVDYVQQGGGLLVTGGVFGLAPEYAGTPIARALPVEIEDRGHVEDPPVALAIMLDRSGSMSAPVGGGSHTKIELAIEASLAAADVLRPTDQVALASVDTETHWDVPLGTVDRLSELRASVRRVTAGGGGIYVYTAMRDAYNALATVKTPIRHVILFSDTNDSEEQAEGCPFESPCPAGKTAESLAREARAKGITTTVVGIGEEASKDTEFLRRVAAAAGGRFYLTTEGADLRRIFLSETRVLAQSNLREKKTTVSSSGAPHPALEGVDTKKLPELAAYVETGRRTGADTALLLADAGRPEGRPMLATWRYGLGKAGVITTDFMEGWGGAWASSPESAQVLKQTVRFLLRQHDAHRADAEVHIRDRVVEVAIELPPDAPDSAAPQSIDVFAIEKSGASRKLTVRLEQRGPGRWIARGRSAGEPIIIVRARDARGALMAEAVGREDRTPELSGVGADMQTALDLARLGDGRVLPASSSSDSLRPTPKPAKELTATWPYALVIASMLVVIDLVLRRLGTKRRDPRTLGARAPIAPQMA